MDRLGRISRPMSSHLGAAQKVLAGITKSSDQTLLWATDFASCGFESEILVESGRSDGAIGTCAGASGIGLQAMSRTVVTLTDDRSAQRRDRRTG